MIPEEIFFKDAHDKMLEQLAQMYRSLKEYRSREKHSETWAKNRADQLTSIAAYMKQAKLTVEAIHAEVDGAYRRGYLKGKKQAEQGTLRPVVWNPFEFHPEVIQKIKNREAQRHYINSKAKIKWHDHY